MIQFIRSGILREYHKKIGFTFTDRQKATLIWKSRQYKRKEILDSLQELANVTEDKELKQQIAERLAYEEVKLTQMKENPDNCFVYVVFDEDYIARGFFRKFEAAYEYATEKGSVCEIEKQEIVENHAPMFTTSLYHAKDKNYDPAKLDSDYVVGCDYFGGPVARCRLDEKGEIIFLASVEISGPQWHLLYDETNSYITGRFESEYVNIPYPDWYLSCGVRNVLTGEYGITDYKNYLEDKEWDCEYYQRECPYDDFDDDSMGIYYLREDGCWYYEFVNPFYLDCGGPDPEVNLEAYMAAGAFCSYHMIEHESLEEKLAAREELIKWCRAHARNCMKGSNIFRAGEDNDFIIYE